MPSVEVHFKLFSSDKQEIFKCLSLMSTEIFTSNYQAALDSLASKFDTNTKELNTSNNKTTAKLSIRHLSKKKVYTVSYQETFALIIEKVDAYSWSDFDIVFWNSVTRLSCTLDLLNRPVAI